MKENVSGCFFSEHSVLSVVLCPFVCPSTQCLRFLSK